jgi:hypothetical protein
MLLFVSISLVGSRPSLLPNRSPPAPNAKVSSAAACALAFEAAPPKSCAISGTSLATLQSSKPSFHT